MKHILVIQNKRIGDVLLTSIIANNIKTVFPESHITYFVYDYTTGVLEGNPNIDEIIAVNERELKKIPNLIKTLWKLRKRKFDIIFDPYNKLQSKLICLCSGTDYRIGFKRPEKKYILPYYSHSIEYLPKATLPCGKSLEDRMRMISEVFDIKTKNYEPKIFLNNQENDYAFYSEVTGPIVVLGVLGSVPKKSMPFEYIAQLSDHIAQKLNATIIFNYAPHQKEDAQKIYELCTHKEHIKLDIYEDSIRGFARLMNASDLLISNEGGSVHIAKALDKPTFTIYSPYIDKDAWCSFENQEKHASVHLKELKPELYSGYSREERKRIEKEPTILYKELKADLIIPVLDAYLEKF